MYVYKYNRLFAEVLNNSYHQTLRKKIYLI